MLAYRFSADLNSCNLGNKSTFRTITHEEVLGLTLVNRCAWDHILVTCRHSRITCILGSRLKVKSKNKLKCFEIFITRA